MPHRARSRGLVQCLDEGVEAAHAVLSFQLARNQGSFAVAHAGEAIVHFALQGRQQNDSLTRRDLEINAEV